jgi:hypothetical protein
MNLSSADQLWKGAAGLAAVAGSLWLVAAKPVFSTAVERLDKGPTRDFLLGEQDCKCSQEEVSSAPCSEWGCW